MNFPSLNTRPDLRELLAFYADAGVDEPLDEEPVNRFELPAPTAAAPRSLAEVPASRSEPQASANPANERQAAILASRPRAVVPDEAQAGLARELAAKAATLDELREAMASFDGCNLKFTAKSTVFAEGNPQAALMLVGEAPGRDEDIEGVPFAGKAGQLLDRMLAAIGLSRSEVHIANVLPWRPPGNREPTPHETEICRPFIERQIELVNPKVLVNLGGLSAKILLQASEGILRLRGNWHSHTTASGIAIPAMPTLHPTYLLSSPNHKKLAWRDLLEVKMKLRELG